MRLPKVTAAPVVLVLLFLCVLFLSVFAGAAQADETADAEAIKALIKTSYIHGAFNAMDPDALERGFHPDFAIFSPAGEEIRKFPIAEWVERTRENKAKPDFDPAKNVWHHTFANLDVTGEAASAKIELYHEGKLVFTDYLSLLKFDSGWRIVAKVYHRHGE